MSEIPDVITGETITSEWGNDIRDRVIQRYATAAARTASVPAPVEGDLSYLNDTNAVYVFDGAAWTPLTPTTITAYEIDGYTEAAAYTVSTSMANAAAVSLTIPTGWASWKCFASASWASSVVANATFSVRLTIDGTALQTVDTLTLVGSQDIGSVVGRRTGMTTTGARTIALQAIRGAQLVDLRDIALYARAVRLT